VNLVRTTNNPLKDGIRHRRIPSAQIIMAFFYGQLTGYYGGTMTNPLIQDFQQIISGDCL
jgi:hypothetical protein